MNRRHAPTRNVGAANLPAVESRVNDDTSLQGDAAGSNRATLVKSQNSKTLLMNNLVSDPASAMGDSSIRRTRINIPENNSRVRKKKDRRKSVCQKAKDLLRTKLDDDRIPVVRVCRIDSVGVFFKSKSEVKELVRSDNVPKEQEENVELSGPLNGDCAKNEANCSSKTEKSIRYSKFLGETCSIRLTRTCSNNKILQHDRNVFQEENKPVEKEKESEVKKESGEKQDLSVIDQINKVADNNVPQIASLVLQRSKIKCEKAIKVNLSKCSSLQDQPANKNSLDQQIFPQNYHSVDKSSSDQQVTSQNKDLLHKTNIIQCINLQEPLPVSTKDCEQQSNVLDQQLSSKRNSDQQIVLRERQSLRNLSSKAIKHKLAVKDPVDESAKRRHLNSDSPKENILDIVEEKDNSQDQKNVDAVVETKVALPQINKDEEFLSKYKITKQLVVQLTRITSVSRDKNTCTKTFLSNSENKESCVNEVASNSEDKTCTKELPSISEDITSCTKEVSPNVESKTSSAKELSEAEEPTLPSTTEDCNEETKRSRRLAKTTKTVPRPKQPLNSRRENMENKSRHNNNNNDNVSNNNQKSLVSNPKDESLRNILKVYNVACNKQSEDQISHFVQEKDTKLSKNNSSQESGEPKDSQLPLEIKKRNRSGNRRNPEVQTNPKLEEEKSDKNDVLCTEENTRLINGDENNKKIANASEKNKKLKNTEENHTTLKNSEGKKKKKGNLDEPYKRLRNHETSDKKIRNLEGNKTVKQVEEINKKVRNIEESNTKVKIVEENKKVKNIEESNKKAKNIEENNKKVNNLEENNIKAKTIEENNTKVKNVVENIKTSKRIQENNTKAKNLEENNKKVNNLEENNKKVKTIEENNIKVKNIEENIKTSKRIQENNKKVKLIEENNKKVKLIEENNKKVKLIEENNKKVKLIEENNKKVKLIEENNKKVKHIEENSTTVKNIEENNKTVKNIEENNKTVKNIEDNNKTVKNIEDNNETVKNVEENDKKLKISEEVNKKVKNVEDINKKVKNSEETNKKVKNSEETNKKFKKCEETNKRTRSADETNRKMANSEETKRRKMNAVDVNQKTKAVIKVVTPRRATIDKVEADQSQNAKLEMLMNATTPTEGIAQQLVSNELEVFSRKIKSKPLTDLSSVSKITKEDTETLLKCSTQSEIKDTMIEEANQAETENINKDEIVVKNKINGICDELETKSMEVTETGTTKTIEDTNLNESKSLDSIETEQKSDVKVSAMEEKEESDCTNCKSVSSNNEDLNENNSQPLLEETNVELVSKNDETISNQPVNNEGGAEVNDLVSTLTNSDYDNIKDMSCSEIYDNQGMDETVLDCIENNSPENKNTCLACKGVVDMIERLEMSLEMSEEEKPSILCPYCTNDFQSLYYLEYHIKQVHIKCENEKLCRHSKYTWLDLSIREPEIESYVTKSLKCRNCYQLYETVAEMNEHLTTDHKNLVYHKLPNAPNTCVVTERRGRGRRKKNAVNGRRNAHMKTNFECSDGCVCGMFAISGCDTAEHMLKVHETPDIPNEPRRLEVAADEVYCCVLCKSIFLLKDEVFNHLLRLHDITCKYPCFSCLVSFRNLEKKENHKCIEQKCFNLNELVPVAILPPTQNGTKESLSEHNNVDEALMNPLEHKTALPNSNLLKNGIKCNSVYDDFLKQSNLNGLDMQPFACPKCKKKFASPGKLREHRFFSHSVHVNRKAAKNILAPVTRANRRRDSFKINTSDVPTCPENSVGVLHVSRPDEQENTKDHDLVQNSTPSLQNTTMQCSKCKSGFKKMANYIRHGYIAHKEDTNVHICDNCGAIMTSVSMVNDHVCKKVDTFSCLRCNENFLNGLELKRHNRTVHFEKAGPHACAICRKCFLTNRMLEKHIRIHHTSLVKFNESNKSEDKDESQNISVDSADLSSTLLDNGGESSIVQEEVMNCNCSICGFSCSSNVSLKNHLKREHRTKVSICQLCNKLILDISEVRHMLEHHIIPTISSASQDRLSYEDSMKEDVNKLIKTLGKERIRSLIVYQDFEGKSNNEIMQCPECSQSFTSYQTCRQHYLWTHDLLCLLCDETFRSASNAVKHKVDSHNSAASYIWCIQRLVTAIMGTLGLDETKKSNILFQILCARLEELETGRKDDLQTSNEKEKDEEPEKLFQVLSEDQLPDPTNMIEVVIGKEDSEDDLLSLLNLSPNYEGVERLPKTDVEPPEGNVFDDNEMEKADDVSGSVIETFISSGICKYRLDQDGKGGMEEQPVLVVTDEDLVTYKDDIGSLARRISATCDILALDEITDMLEAYFHSVHNT